MKISERYGLRQHTRRPDGQNVLFRRLLEHVNEAVGAFDRDENPIYVNPAFGRLTGYACEECMKMTCFDFFDEASRKIIMKEGAKRKHGISSKYEAVLISKSGEKIPVLISGSPLGMEGSIGVITDLREIKRRDATIKKFGKNEKLLGAILGNSADAIISLDLEHNVLSWNKSATMLFGYTEDEMVGQQIDRILPKQLLAEGEIERMRAETNNKGGLRNFHTVRLTKNGHNIPVSISQSQLLDEKKQMFGYTVIYRDISAQKKWEDELQLQFEKMQAAYQEMGKQRRYLDYIDELLDIALSKSDFADLANYIVNAFLMFSQADAVTFRSYDPKKDSMRLEAATGVSKEWWSRRNIQFAGSIHEKVKNEKKPYKILDVWYEPTFHSPGLARKNNLKSALILPLINRQEFIGSIVLYISPEKPFSLLDNEFIGIFAKQVALVLGHIFSIGRFSRTRRTISSNR